MCLACLEKRKHYRNWDQGEHCLPWLISGRKRQRLVHLQDWGLRVISNEIDIENRGHAPRFTNTCKINNDLMMAKLCTLRILCVRNYSPSRGAQNEMRQHTLVLVHYSRMETTPWEESQNTLYWKWVSLHSTQHHLICMTCSKERRQEEMYKHPSISNENPSIGRG